MNSTILHRQILLLIFLCSMNNYVFASDLEAGKAVATACFNCHGTNGNSKTPHYPSLAGQRPSYLKNQIKAFQSGQRINPLMQSMVAKLTNQDIENVSAYFANLNSESAGGVASLIQKGLEKSSMCKGCHGGSAQGMGNFPKLAGQQAKYLENQLMSFKNRSRKGAPMNAIASSLSEQEIKEIAAYLGSL